MTNPMIKAYEAIKEEYEAHAVYKDFREQWEQVIENEILLRKKFITAHTKRVNITRMSAIDDQKFLELINHELENFKKSKSCEQPK